MKFAKAVFWIAAIYGFVAVPPLYFLESRIGQMSPPAITHPEYFYGFAGLALAWQLLFVLIARDPQRYRPAMLPAIVEKLGFGLASLTLYLQGRLSLQGWLVSTVDLLFALLFALAFVRVGRRLPVRAEGGLRS